MKDNKFTFRVSGEELELIRERAQEAGMSVSKYIIQASVKPIIKIEGLKEYTEQIRKIGVNLNQIATLCHQGKIKCVELENTRMVLSDLWKEVSNFRKDIRKLEEFNGDNQVQG